MTIRNIIIFLSILIFVGACSKELPEQELIESAKNHLDKGELREASIQLKNVLQKNPQQPEARWLLSNIHLEIGDYAAAEKELNRAQELGVMEDSIRPLLARAYAENGKYEEALSLQTAGLSPAAQASILAAQAMASIALNRLEQAQTQVTQALALQAGLAEAVTEQARLAIARNEKAQARELLESLLKKEEKYAPAWSLLSEIERLEQQPEKAEAALSKAIKHRHNNAVDRLKRAIVRIELKKYKEAQTDIDALKKRMPKYFELHYAQGLLHYEQRRLTEARSAFEAAVNANDKFLPSFFYLGATYLELDQVAQAENMASRFVAANPNYVPGRKLLAQIRLREGKFAEAEQLIQPVANADASDGDALNILATALIQQKKIAAAVAILEQAAATQPQSAEVHLRLGNAYLAQGNEAQGIKSLETALSLDAEKQANVHESIIRYYLQNKAFDQALARAESYRQAMPDKAPPYNLLGLVHLAKQESDAAKNAFKEADKRAPGDITANLSLAALAMSGRDYRSARQHYDTILKQHPDQMETLIKLAQLEQIEGHEPEMVKRLEQAITAQPQAVEPRVILARHHLRQGAPEKVGVALGNLQQSRFDHPDVVEVIGQSQLAQRASAEARTSFNRLVELQPGSAQAHFLLAIAHAQLGEIKQVRSELEKSLELDKGHLTARLALARLHLIQNETGAAKQHLATLKTLAPDNADVKRLEAGLAESSGEQEKALDIYSEIFAQNSTTTNMLELARQKWNADDRAGAIGLLETWLKEHPEDVAARLQLANAYANDNKPDAANSQYQSILEKNPGNLIALNNLAWNLKESKPKQALEYAEKASSLAPDSASVSDTLALILMKNGQHERALRISQDLVTKHPGNTAFSYHRALILSGVGMNEEARTQLNQLLSGTKTFPEQNDAKRLLAQLQAK